MKALTPIAARSTTEQLAGALEASLPEVQAALEARGEPSAPGDIVAPLIAVEVAADLGRKVAIEPRDLALEMLYELESRDDVEFAGAPDRVAQLVKGVVAQKERLDQAIEAASEHWSVARMPVIDRTILRIGLYELEQERDTPTPVIVNEAVRLAKTYSTEKSGSFVNGVLAALAGDVRRGG